MFNKISEYFSFTEFSLSALSTDRITKFLQGLFNSNFASSWFITAFIHILYVLNKNPLSIRKVWLLLQNKGSLKNFFAMLPHLAWHKYTKLFLIAVNYFFIIFVEII